MLYLAGIFIAFFSSLLIFGKKRKDTADYVLAIWFLIIGVHLGLFFLNFTESYFRNPDFLGLEIPFPLVHGPMLYLYIRSLTHENHHKYHSALHFLPCLLIYFILWSFFSLPTVDKIIIYQTGGGTYRSLRMYINITIYVSGCLYIGLSILSVWKYQKEISRQYSNIEKINLNWVYCLIMGITVIWLLVILEDDVITFTSVVFFVLFAAYFGITRVGILNLPDNMTNINEEKGSEGSYVKYQKSALNTETMQEIYTALNNKMDREKLFKDPELSLNTIAAALEIHPNVLSQTINSIENKNFYDYINSQRIEEFKRIAVLPENQKFTMLSLAYESGFNSKTSFNRNFKKYTKCSPREFMKAQNLNLT